MNTITEPKAGFYYHYKHDPRMDPFNYAYEVLNIAHHTEEEDFDGKGAMVVYRPLYEARVYREGRHWDVRPRDMFLENVEKGEYSGPRFKRITDPIIVETLKIQRKKMYGM